MTSPPFTLSPDPTPKRRHFSGAKAHHAGKTFEELVLLYARQSPIAHIHRLPRAGGAFVKMPQGLRFVPDKHNLIPCDIIGALGGLGFFCDCKSTADSRELPVEMLKEHQVRFLAEMAQADQVAGLIVEVRTMGVLLWRDGLRLDGPLPWRIGDAISKQWDQIGTSKGGIDWAKLRGLY